MSARDSGGLETFKTGSHVSNCIFRLKKVAPAYQLDVGNVGLSMFDILGPFSRFSAEAFGRPVDAETGDFEAGCPSEINVDISGVDVEHAVTARTRPVVPLNWRRIRC